MMTVIICNCRTEAADSVAQTSPERCQASRGVCARACKPTADQACCARSRVVLEPHVSSGFKHAGRFGFQIFFKCKGLSWCGFLDPKYTEKVHGSSCCHRCSQHPSASQRCPKTQSKALPNVSLHRHDMRPVNPNYDWRSNREGRGLPTQVRRRAKRAARPKHPPLVIPATFPAGAPAP